MEHQYWHQRWQEEKIGFHLPDVNELLQTFLPKLGLRKKDTVFVPLCGKSHDLIYLRDMGMQVIGIELNARAVEAFFAENHIEAKKTHLAEHNLILWEAEGIKIYQGDFFALDKSLVSTCKAVYDRAALVALPVELRLKYVQHLQAILAAEVKMLLLSLEYDESRKQGPPFSVTETDIRNYFQPQCKVSLLATQGTPEAQKSATSQGVSIIDKVYLIES